MLSTCGWTDTSMYPWTEFSRVRTKLLDDTGRNLTLLQICYPGHKVERLKHQNLHRKTGDLNISFFHCRVSEVRVGYRSDECFFTQDVSIPVHLCKK